MAVNPEGTLCQSRDAAWSGIRATKGVVNKGKYYYEATVSDEGLCRVGWSLNEVSNKNFVFFIICLTASGAFTFYRVI
jgi:ATP-dependent RNA helicase DDX1